MKFYHYTNEPFELQKKQYPQTGLNFFRGKPEGLWISVESESFDDSNCNWKEWCESEPYELEYLKFRYEIKFNDDSNILFMKTNDEVKEFTKKYLPERDPEITSDYKYLDLSGSHIDWNKVAKEYQGIIIAPYQWDCRLRSSTSWYYGWDCSSGCIWDLEVIKSFELVQE